MNIPAGAFKARCLKLMEQVKLTQEEIVITKHGKPVAKLVPITEDFKPSRTASGFLRGTVRILGDIVAPTGAVWSAGE